MRSLVVVGLLTLSALSGWACSCHDETVVPNRTLTATGSWQVGGVMSSVPEATYAEQNAVEVGNRNGPKGPPSGPFDLTLRGLFILRDANGQTPMFEPIPRVAFQLTVHGVLAGPAEIDLDDSRATL